MKRDGENSQFLNNVVATKLRTFLNYDYRNCSLFQLTSKEGSSMRFIPLFFLYKLFSSLLKIKKKYEKTLRDRYQKSACILL